jgi:sulfur dioxygenase
MIQCATSNRASAAAALCVARAKGWGAEEALAWAREKNLKFTSTQPLRNWVAAALASPKPSAAADVAHGNLIFRQLFEPLSSTYTYLLGDPVTRQAVLIDPVVEKAERDAQAARELGLNVVVALNTHVHADHVSGTSRLKTFIPGLRSGIAGASGAAADLCLADGDVIPFGGRSLRVLSTPGHTDGCLSFLLDDNSAVFTGDALLIRGCGRTDFQQGSADRLYSSITGKIFTLPPACVVYPGHDYNGHLHSTVAEERVFNNRLGHGRTREDFIAIMAGLNLPAPKQLDRAVPANLRDGVEEVMEAGGAGYAPVPPACERCRQDGGVEAAAGGKRA